MADWICHGALGAGTMSAATRAAGGSRLLAGGAAVYGFVFGSGPDTIDWAAAAAHLAPRWELYTRFHHFDPWWMCLHPPWLMHVLLDKFFHRPDHPGWNWWPQMGWLELTMWYIALLLFWYAFYREPYDHPA
jgi:hypothetical protein